MGNKEDKLYEELLHDTLLSEEKSGKMSYNEKIETALSDMYEFRYNVIKERPDFRKDKSDEFLPVQKYDLNTFRRNLDRKGIRTSVENIRTIIESEFSERVNPILDYFKELNYKKNLPGREYIKDLADTVEVTQDKTLWYRCLKKWLVAVVANIYDDHFCRNHTCLVLTGKQGTFKTTWLENLCPKSLSTYMFTGKINPNNKDVLSNLAECFLINIDDQLQQLNRRDENDLKELITVNRIKYRRAYGPFNNDYPHLASFMASVNGNDFLTDDTGSRRFLPFEINKIDINAAKKIPIDHLWREVFSLYKGNFKYHFDTSEMEELNLHNQRFNAVSQEEELLLQYYKKPAKRPEATHYMPTTLILVELKRWSGLNNLSKKKLGSALNKHEFEKWQKDRRWVWSVIENFKTGSENNNDSTPF